ncbi:MAG: flagellin, partial [Deferrisomatales bacterium]|nr:flagellin [Deferrisomatales bacterium]
YAGATETATLDVTAIAVAAGADTTTYTAALGTGTAVAVTDNATVALTDENGNSANVTFGTVAAGTDGSIGTFVDNSLVFQVGANQNQTVAIALQDVSADALAVGVTNDSGFGNLSEILIGTATQATDAIGLIDDAIDQISVIRGNLGAFQANTLEANLDSLRVSAENLQASESIIRDTDMAAEMATFTKYQIMLQAGTSMLAQANQIPNNLLTLLR